MRFQDVINELNKNLENRLFTVCDGAHAGEKMIVSSGKPVWMSDEEGFFSAHASEAISAMNGALTEIGGESVFAELLGNEKELVVCGAGHVSMAIIRTAKMMGFKVTAIDDRLKFANDAIAQGADNVIFKDFKEALADIPGSKDTFFVIVTRGHRYDKECLRCITQKPHAYIGMMGSRRRVMIVKNELAEEGISREILDSVHTPIGLSIGAETPEEIAISVMAEIIEVKNTVKRNFAFPREIMNAILPDERESMTLATIIARQGSAPRAVGTKMLIAKDGSIAGTIGGGCIESNVIAKGRRMLLEEGHKPAILEVDMSRDAAEDEGMVCGGKVKVLLEVV